MKTILQVPYTQRNKAKRLGAKWCPESKHWYTLHADLQPFTAWLTRSEKVELGFVRVIGKSEPLVHLAGLADRYNMQADKPIDQSLVAIMAKRMNLDFREMAGTKWFSVNDAPVLFKALRLWQQSSKAVRKTLDFHAFALQFFGPQDANVR